MVPRLRRSPDSFTPPEAKARARRVFPDPGGHVDPQRGGEKVEGYGHSDHRTEAVLLHEESADGWAYNPNHSVYRLRHGEYPGSGVLCRLLCDERVEAGRHEAHGERSHHVPHHQPSPGRSQQVDGVTYAPRHAPYGHSPEPSDGVGDVAAEDLEGQGRHRAEAEEEPDLSRIRPRATGRTAEAGTGSWLRLCSPAPFRP